MSADVPAARRVRKTVTALFADVTGSTALGEQLDPEALQTVLDRYFAEMRSVIALHGGTVEKFIGDAVMAVFGVPHVHEDDALRAVRAAVDMRAGLDSLNAELTRDQGVALEARIGVNTGEVVAGDPGSGQSFVAGDAVNVAARLQQAAGPGEILIGSSTRRLVGEAARIEPIEPLTLNGKTEPVPAWRLLEVLAGAHVPRRIDSPFVGRERELTALLAACERAEAGTCELVTVLGEPGVGKSRLVREFLRSTADRARSVAGRCLPYGEGITYWPLSEIVRDVAGPDGERLAAIVGNELAADRLAGAIGLGVSVGPSEETQWAARKLFEAMAAEQPLVVVFDDVHWAEPTLLDLVEYVAGFSTEFPILLLCIARPDLLEARPSWTNPRPNATVLPLEPLAEDDTVVLVDRLVTAVSANQRDRILQAAEGNPLFVEQLVAHLAENERAGNGGGIPPSLQALLAARIDGLAPAERAAIESASIEGRGFHRGAVVELVPEEHRPAVVPSLMGLVRKELIRPGRSDFPADDGFRFGHILIRDAAYAAVPKRLRAELHERFAGWLEQKAGEHAAEYEEILGYHLEQAVLYRRELGPLGEAGEAIARRAAERLGSTGRRALERNDLPAAANLLERGASLLPPGDAQRLDLLPTLGETLVDKGELDSALALLEDAVDEALTAGDGRAEERARVELALARLFTASSGYGELRAVAGRAGAVLEALSDDRGVARAFLLLGQVEFWAGSCTAAEDWLGRAEAHARAAGDQRQATESAKLLADALTMGPAATEDALVRIEALLEQVGGDRPAEAHLLGLLGETLASAARFDEARAAFERRRAIAEELGLHARLVGQQSEGIAALFADDPVAAEAALRPSYEALEEMGEKGWRSTTAALLALALELEGRVDEAEELAEVSRTLGHADDFATQTLWRQARARVLARRGELEEAQRLAREAVEWVAATDFVSEHADALMTLAGVLRPSARAQEAVHAARDALALYEAKGHVVGAERAHRFLSEVDGADRG